MSERIVVVQGDITRLDVEAIVNAANNTLLGGGGVDGAIHRAAGPRLVMECATLGGCSTGEAKITSGYKLKAKWVIHTVGPVWHGGGSGEDELLVNCYRNSLRIAATGIYGYPLDLATGIAVAEARAFLDANALPERVTFVCFGADTQRVYLETLASRS